MSMSQSTGSSQSTATPVHTLENDLIDQIAQYAQSLATQMDSWAAQEFTKSSQLTDQAVGNFFHVSQQMGGLSDKMTDQYNRLTAPEYQSLHDEAASFASPSRMSVDMGQAGATQAQAGEQAIHNSEEALKSYGINPSDGRYASLDEAARVQNSANVAGAMNMQRNADIATGHGLRQQALQFGATLPGAIANANNTAIQANSGAVNSTLANANTGANLKALADKYLSTAMGIKLPPMGNTSSSSQQSSSHSPEPQRQPGSGSGGGSGGGGLGGGYGGGSAWSPDHSGAGTGGITSIPGSDDYASGSGQSEWDPSTWLDPDQSGEYPGSNPAGYGDQAGNSGLWDPGQNQAQLPDDWQPLPQTDPNTNWDGGGNSMYGNEAPSSAFDYGSGQDYSNVNTGDYGEYNYARGGAIPDGGIIQSKVAPRPMPARPGSEGPVPASMSPSGGQKVDDVQAQGPGGQQLNLNAGEFMIPQDVALWKGQEFFQNLIIKSRQMRLGAPAKPTPTR